MEHTLPAPFTGKDATRNEPPLVIAQANNVGVPVDTLGTIAEVSTIERVGMRAHSLTWVDWFMDGPGQPTRRVMRPNEFRHIEEG